jgi:hypothetical protein
MTPKEKADELVKKMYEVRSGYVSMITYSFAKQCALVAVDEMLEELDHLAFDDHDYGTSKMIYWQEVKQEINKLSRYESR